MIALEGSLAGLLPEWMGRLLSSKIQRVVLHSIRKDDLGREEGTTFECLLCVRMKFGGVLFNLIISTNITSVTAVLDDAQWIGLN